MSSRSEVFLNKRHEIQRLADMAEQFAADHQLSDSDLMAVTLTLDEVVTNVILHGYDDEADHEIKVTLTVEGDDLTIEVEDDARPFDPRQVPPPDLALPLDDRPIGGLGVHLVRSLMDGVEYERRGGRNVLTLRKTLRQA